MNSMLIRFRSLKALLIIFVMASTANVSQSQTDTSKLQISLLTCSPGEELYSSWGHTAIRVVDSVAGTDNVFNYGTFDDSDPLFLPRFTKGLMIYSLSFYPYQEFLAEYRYFNRGVIEQVLALDCASKQKLYQALLQNYAGNNRFYEYYFHTDNCTTRARDMILQQSAAPVHLKPVISQPAPSFRKLIHQYLDSSGQRWNKLGIDILLGANLDKKTDSMSATFLPDYLMMAVDSALIGSTPLVSEKRQVLPAPALHKGSSLLSPLFVFSILAVVIFLLSFSTANPVIRILKIFDVVFFLLLGLLGCLLATLWIIRIDTVCRNNYNLAWLLPSHLPFAFLMGKKSKVVRMYWQITMIISSLFLLLAFFLPQQINPAVIPLVFIILIRCGKRLTRPDFVP